MDITPENLPPDTVAYCLIVRLPDGRLSALAGAVETFSPELTAWNAAIMESVIQAGALQAMEIAGLSAEDAAATLTAARMHRDDAGPEEHRFEGRTKDKPK